MARRKKTRTSRPPASPEPRELIDDGSELVPQWNTTTEEPYFVRESDGRCLSLEEAGAIFAARDDAARRRRSALQGDERFHGSTCDEPTPADVAQENAFLLRRQSEFRAAAENVAREMSRLPQVLKVVLFGSVAGPLSKEVPRFREFRSRGIELFHECKDVDLAVWLSDDSDLASLRKAVVRGLKDKYGNAGPVASHQVDVFLMIPGTDAYLGRLCGYNACPKGKRDCATQDCGKVPFLRPDVEFDLDWVEASQRSVVLYER